MIGKRNFFSTRLLSLLFMLSIFFVPLTHAEYCGDINKDGSINILDIVDLINHKYKGGPPPMPMVIGDVDQSGEIDILDIVCLINFKYKGGPPPDCGIVGSAAVQGECKSGGTGPGDTQFTSSDCLRESDGENSMYVEMIEGDLFVYHENAYYNCCLEYRVEFVIDGSNITAYEYDDGSPCDCNCYFNLESVLEDLEPFEYTTYTVTLIGIDGEPVGTDTVSPEDFDYMSLNLLGNDLQIYHMDAYYNCCLEYQVVYSIMGNGINIFEFDIGSPCYCMCFFDLETIIEDIPVGQYFVTLFDIEGDTVGHESIEIGTTGELTDYSTSGCLGASRGDISYLYSDGILTMQDINSTWNCGAAIHEIIVEFEQIVDTLRFTERSTFSGLPTTCQCGVDITATVSNIMPYQYVAEIYRVRFAGFDPELVDRRIITLE